MHYKEYLSCLPVLTTNLPLSGVTSALAPLAGNVQRQSSTQTLQSGGFLNRLRIFPQTVHTQVHLKSLVFHYCSELICPRGVCTRVKTQTLTYATGLTPGNPFLQMCISTTCPCGCMFQYACHWPTLDTKFERQLNLSFHGFTDSGDHF